MIARQIVSLNDGQQGLGGLDDRDKSGRPAEIDELDIVNATLVTPPPELGITHWSSRILAGRLGISHVNVAKIWKRWGLKPRKLETFEFSTHPELEATVRDVVGLYLNPPEKAVVLSIDGKSQVQALDRTAPMWQVVRIKSATTCHTGDYDPGRKYLGLRVKITVGQSAVAFVCRSDAKLRTVDVVGHNDVAPRRGYFESESFLDVAAVLRVETQ